MRKSTFLTLLGVLVALVAVQPNAAAAPQDELCHWDGKKYQKIIETEMDGAVGDPVPKMPGHVFDELCEPIADKFLVHANSRDAAGKEIVIAGLMDKDGDNVPSSGDTAVFIGYPTDFHGNNYQNFPVRNCEVESASVDDAQRSVRVNLNPDCRIEVAYWTKRTVAGQEHERFGVRYDLNAKSIDLMDCETFLKKDWVSVDGNNDPEESSEKNDTWLHVVFDF